MPLISQRPTSISSQPIQPLDIVIIGLTITSSWGNGHATTYRGLVRELVRRGHHVLFLEHDKPWYASNRDLPEPPYGSTRLYRSVDELIERYSGTIRSADLVIVGSYVPEGVAVGKLVTQIAQGVTAFYDIDTPVTLAKFARGHCEYLSPELIPRYGLYLSFTGGPTLDRLEKEFGANRALPLYCSVDPELYNVEPQPCRWDLGYLGTYSTDRQSALTDLLVNAAAQFSQGRFVVAGPQYPHDIIWPSNVERIEHLPPSQHRRFYNQQRFTLNITRQDMICAGYSPSVRLFEAAACGVAIITDDWPGLDSFFQPGSEILISRNTDDTLRYLREMNDVDRLWIAGNARRRILQKHTAAHRAAELERYALQAMGRIMA